MKIIEIEMILAKILKKKINAIIMNIIASKSIVLCVSDILNS